MYKEEAVKRKKIVSNVSYNLLLALMKGETFEGHVVVSFDVTEDEFDGNDLFLDYHGLGIKDLQINETHAESHKAFDGQRIKITKDLLKKGARNSVSIVFKSKYRNDGTG